MSRRRVAVLVLVALCLGVSGYFGRSVVGDALAATVDGVGDWSTRLRELAAAEPETEVALRTRSGESLSALVAIGSGDGDAAFALLASDPDGPATLIVLPQDLLLPVPGFGEFRLVDALAFGGADLAALAITNQFGTRIDHVVQLPSGSISDGPLGPVVVDLSVPLFVENPDGSIERVLAAGRTEVTPDFVETLLVTIGSGDAFEWIQRQGSAWRTILGEVANAPGVADRIMALGGLDAADVADLLVTVAGDPDALLATIPVGSANSAAGDDALIPAGEQALNFVADRLDHLLLRPGGRPRIEILNGNGRIGTTADIAAILIRDGFRLVRTDNADHFDYQDTLVVAQGDHAEAWAREILDLLGRGLLFLEVRAPSGVVDVSIIIGNDIPSGEG